MSSDVLDDEAAPPPAPDDDYHLTLARRAESFVRERGGTVHEQELIGHVFGSAGSPRIWRPLLEQVLVHHERLLQRSDGCWVLLSEPAEAGPGLLPEFVALDVETTGLRPLHQRIIEVAAIRFRGGLEIERFATLVNPETRIPEYIAKLTGITDQMVAEAPPFRQFAEHLDDFLGSTLIVGHNVGFDISFVNAEFKRLGRPALGNSSLDTLALAVRFIPNIRRPNLERVATALNLLSPGKRLHRAEADAGITASVALRLASIAEMQGVREIESLTALANPVRRPRDGVGRGRAVLDRSLLTDIPRLPGVYLMRDSHDHVIYVGKATNLRDRVASYYSQPLNYTRKMDGLLESLARIDVEVVGSELEALLLESQLIKRYQPRYNTALRSFEHFPYIRVDVSNPWPRVTLARSRKDDGARYFGPFRNQRGARQTVDLINRATKLRTCSRSFKDARSYGSPCIELDLKRCMGPCVGRANRDDYRVLVRDVVRFLDGADDVLYDRLWQELEDAAARYDFERARRIKQDLQQAAGIASAHRSLREAIDTHYLILVLPSAEPQAREILMIASGRLWAQLRADPGEPVDRLTQRLRTSWERLRQRGVDLFDSSAVDATNILNRWLARHDGHPSIMPYPAPPGEPDWSSLAAGVLALRDEDFVFDARVFDAAEEMLAADAVDQTERSRRVVNVDRIPPATAGLTDVARSPG